MGSDHDRGVLGLAWGVLLMAWSAAGCLVPEGPVESDGPRPSRLRVATFNIEDLRGDDLRNPEHPRARALAAILQEIRPDVVLINEIAYDQEGSPGWSAEEGEGRNGRRLAAGFLAVSQGEGLAPLIYRAFMAPVNTGMPSGFDLDNDGFRLEEMPDLPPQERAGGPGRQTAEGRAWGADAWGFGTFPGQYGMALLVREGLEIVADEARTFQRLPWAAMPDALEPVDPETGESWYGPDEWAAFRLSSKSHWDVPVRLPDGSIVHFLASHPTPPVFDGPEMRNKRRNHDEIRFWAEYLSGEEWIVDDAGRPGGLSPRAEFVILGDLNADPDEGDSLDDPIGRWLLAHPRVNGDETPVADAAGRAAYPDLDPDDTAGWGLRVDYVLPSTGLKVAASGVWRPDEDRGGEVSDHFPVWIDLELGGDRDPADS